MIYFALAVKSGTVKVGHTDGPPEARLKALSTGCPHDLALLAVEAGNKVREAELHRRFDHLRARGEWFRLEADLIEHLVELMVDRITDQPDDLKQWLGAMDLVAEEVASSRDNGVLWTAWGLSRLADNSGEPLLMCRYFATATSLSFDQVAETVRRYGFASVRSLSVEWSFPAFFRDDQIDRLVAKLEYDTASNL